MSHRKAKSAPKTFETNPLALKDIVLRTMGRVAEIVGSSMGPGGRNVLIESDFPGIPNKNTKDGVTIFKSLGANNAYEHLIIEQARDVAQRTVSEAGDGTTTATVLSNAIIRYMFEFCDKNKKYSPQKAAREISKVTKDLLLPFIKTRSIPVTADNQHLLKMVAKISANGDEDMAVAVIKAFEEIGYGDASHVTIRELTGPTGYTVERIDGFPIPVGFEESAGKIHPMFINDQGNQRCDLANPKFLLLDSQLNDMVSVEGILQAISQKYVGDDATPADPAYKNVVIFAHGFSENVVNTLAYNFPNPQTINIIPMLTPMSQILNSQTHFLHDLAAFTGARVFNLKDQVADASFDDLGKGMESFEAYRFRSTIVGDPDPTNVEVRAEDLRVMMKNAESQIEKILLEERIGKITNGIAKLTIYGGSNGELKEAHDRCEDAVCAVRASISHGALPGGCRLSIDMALKLSQDLEPGHPAREVLVPALLELPKKLLSNAGYTDEEFQSILVHLVENPNDVYDIENQKFGKAEELGLFDATRAVSESLSNAVSIATILGTMGGIVCHPRDGEFERSEARLDSEFTRAVDNPNSFVNEANQRP